ncbi:MAG: DUF1273 family protein [Clostridia bacterium]|nr:DUF1273 family protein [Clostridia bacterium]
MKRKTACFTGHREISPAHRLIINLRLSETIENLIEEGYSRFVAGGALGFDTLAAMTVLAMKKRYPYIRLALILPCRDQADRWSEHNQRIYAAIMARADEVIYTADRYVSGCMQIRNRRLVDESSVCIAYLNKSVGGTAYTVRYAEQQGLAVINLANGPVGRFAE